MEIKKLLLSVVTLLSIAGARQLYSRGGGGKGILTEEAENQYPVEVDTSLSQTPLNTQRYLYAGHSNDMPESNSAKAIEALSTPLGGQNSAKQERAALEKITKLK